MNDRKDEIRRRVNLHGYFDKLEHLTGYRPEIDDLTSPQFVVQIRAELSNHLKSAPVAKTVIPFTERLSSRFAALIGDLELRNPHPVFVWIEAANECGFTKPIRLADFRFGFEFERIPEGLISLITTDAKDKMLMDFEVDDDGLKIMTVELHGSDWGNAEPSSLTSAPTPDSPSSTPRG